MSAAGRGPGEDYINRETKYPAVTLRSYIIKCHMVSCKNTRILSEGSSGILNWFLSYHIFAHLYIISCHHNMLQKLLQLVLWFSDIPIFFVFPSWHKIAYFSHRKPMLLVQKCWLPWSSWMQISIQRHTFIILMSSVLQAYALHFPHRRFFWPSTTLGFISFLLESRNTLSFICRLCIFKINR